MTKTKSLKVERSRDMHLTWFVFEKPRNFRFGRIEYSAGHAWFMPEPGTARMGLNANACKQIATVLEAIEKEVKQ